jgi:hypothetical protein
MSPNESKFLPKFAAKDRWIGLSERDVLVFAPNAFGAILASSAERSIHHD